MLKIEAVDLLYLSMPEIRDIGDGSQDALLVRIQAGPHVGWGECEASPLVSIASFVCPMSHSACKPVRDSVLGQRLASTADIWRIGELVRENSLDLLQADHTFSGIDIALWDLWGKANDAPVYQLLGYERAYGKIPYASQLFADTPEETLERAREVRQSGYQAAKFGWGPYGKTTVAADRDQVMAAREGLGPDLILLVDAGTVWKEDVGAACLRLPILEDCDVLWLEEPFVSGALNAYRTLTARGNGVKIAGGEGSHNFYMAQQMIDQAGLGYIQIDAGRIGGITIAKRVADYAAARGVTYVNHTFTSHLALSASLQPYAGLADHSICEYPTAPSSLAAELTKERLLPDNHGQIQIPDRPGLGITPNPEAIRRYLVDLEIRVNGRIHYRTPHSSDIG